MWPTMSPMLQPAPRRVTAGGVASRRRLGRQRRHVALGAPPHAVEEPEVGRDIA